MSRAPSFNWTMVCLRFMNGKRVPIETCEEKKLYLIKVDQAGRENPSSVILFQILLNAFMNLYNLGWPFPFGKYLRATLSKERVSRSAKNAARVAKAELSE